MRRMMLALALVATAAVAQPQHDRPFAFPVRILEFSLVQTTASHQQHVDRGDTLRYVNTQAVYVADTDTLLIFRSRFDSDLSARRMAAKMAENTRTGKGGYAESTQDTVLGIAVNATATVGKAHFFFQNDRDIFWLTGSPLYCYEFLEAFLKIAGFAKGQPDQ